MTKRARLDVNNFNFIIVLTVNTRSATVSVNHTLVNSTGLRLTAVTIIHYSLKKINNQFITVSKQLNNWILHEK